MSHFSLAVITDENTYYEGLLERYCENTDCLSPEYLEFVDKTEEIEERFANNVDCVELPDGKIIPIYDELAEPYFVKDENGYSQKNKVIDGCKLVTAPIANFYETIDDLAAKYFCYEFNEEQKCWGYWTNPNAKWDWYTIGGRWSDRLNFKDGTVGDSGLIDDIDFEAIESANYERAKETYEECTEINYEDPSFSEELRNRFIAKYPTFEDYFKTCTSFFTTYAVITPDGEWHEPGEMLYFGLTTATREDEEKWDENYFKDFIEPYLNQNMTITIVDCHI